MTYLWRITDERHAARQQRATTAANAVSVKRQQDGSYLISTPLLRKLADPLNTCLCPDCLLQEDSTLPLTTDTNLS